MRSQKEIQVMLRYFENERNKKSDLSAENFTKIRVLKWVLGID